MEANDDHCVKDVALSQDLYEHKIHAFWPYYKKSFTQDKFMAMFDTKKSKVLNICVSHP